MKKRNILKILLGIVIFILSTLTIAAIIISEPRPNGTAGPQAEALADSMLSALGYQQYQELEQLNWAFPRGHRYRWNRKENIVNVKWDEFDVTFSPDTREGTASENGRELTGVALSDALYKAWTLFANDSFWVVAPFKVKDPGTTRSLVTTEDGPALLITYTSGGVTPGDSYLWYLDDNYRPIAWKMYVKILPIGGLRFSWEEWRTIEGVQLSTVHEGPINYTLKISDLSGF